MVKTPPANAREVRNRGSIPRPGKPPGGGDGSPPQCSCLGIPGTEEPGGLQSMGSQSQARLSTQTYITL